MDELLTLRLALLAVIFVFLAATAYSMRRGLLPAPAARRPRAGQSKLPALVIIAPAGTGISAGAAIELPGGMTIGRSADCGIVLNDASVSGHHAEMLRTPGGWVIRDRRSTNGTFVNGGPVGSRGVALAGGEEVTLGSVVLLFQL